MDKEKIKFIQVVSQPAIAASGKTQLDLRTLVRDFGNNYNTLSIINTSAASSINIYLDGKKVQYVSANNGVWSFDWEFGLHYTLLEIENNDAVNVIPLDTVKISIGRTGI